MIIVNKLMNKNIENILDVVENNKQKLTDNDYKIIMDNLKTINILIEDDEKVYEMKIQDYNEDTFDEDRENKSYFITALVFYTIGIPISFFYPVGFFLISIGILFTLPFLSRNIAKIYRKIKSLF